MNTVELFLHTQVERVIGELPLEITSLETDSRKVQKGGVYVAIKGYTVDGHSFIDDVVKKGVSVVVVESVPEKKYEEIAIVQVKNTERIISRLANAFYGYPSKQMNVTGITGTNGKTSTAKIMNDILRAEGIKTGMTGTVGVDIAGEVRKSLNTTEEALTIQKNLREMVDAGVTDVTMEVSSHGLMLGRLSGVQFNQAVFTNLTQDHLDFHGTMEEYKNAKGLLFSQLGQDLESDQFVVFNADEEVSGYYEKVTSANVLTYGVDKDADFKAVNIEYANDSTTFQLETNASTYLVKTPFVGKFNVSNVLAAIATLAGKGLSIEKIIGHLQHVQAAEGRMEKIITNKARTVFVDYAHTPDGIEQVLNSVKNTTTGKIIFVIGTGGNRDKTKRPIMAQKASSADYVVLTTDNPRFESPHDILSDMEKGIVGTRYVKIVDREEAIFHAIEEAAENDVVIIAGKGHEQYQIIEDKTIPFNDKEVALRAIRKICG